MKRKVVIEFELPEDDVYGFAIDGTGIQAYSETIRLYSGIGASLMESKSYEQPRDESFIESVSSKCKIINSAKIVGYFDNDNNHIEIEGV